MDEEGVQPIFVRLARAVADAIRAGRLTPGSRIPSTRALALELDLNRNTVVAAMRELHAEGWIQSEHGRGTFVSRELPEPRGRRVTAASSPASRHRVGFDVPDGSGAADDEPVAPGAIKWDFGVPDVRLAPTKALARAYRRAIHQRAGRLLQYTRYREERESRLQIELAAMLAATRGIVVAPSQIVVTHGSQMALYLVARALLRPGDVVAMEDPGFYLAKATFELAGARVVRIPVDGAGLEVKKLHELAAAGTKVRAVFATPHHQFPTTVSLSPSRRIELRRFAVEHRVAIIEDDYDHEFHYDGRPLLPLASADPENSVIYLGSLSKVLAPGVRLGYVVAHPRLIREIEAIRGLIDSEGNQPLEAALAELIEDGELQRHLNRARRIYAARRDHLVRELERELSGALRFTVPSGGMALWARANVDVERWAKQARGRGLLVRTGRIFSFDQKPLPFLRLGFARMTEDELSSVVKELARASSRRVLRQPRRR